MYCPGCSTQSIEGAKFCKSCGMNLTAITQALNGGVIISDPVRDREYKRARKQITDGIQGVAIGAGILVAAALTYFIIPGNSYVYGTVLALALVGIIKLFRSIGSIIDAKVGQKLLDPALQPRGTGGLSASQPLPPPPVAVRPSQRLVPDPARPPAPSTRPVSIEQRPAAPP
ncbi:MAG TPA: hypothetical protein VNO14_01830, partial [Blastocatellia bacterium]|nr:hypothetical protein [Blastocatellia bacterium]